MGTLAAAVILIGPVAVTAPAEAATVTVQPGETLSQIAARADTSVAGVAALNGIADPNLIVAGTVLRLPGGVAAPRPGAPAAPSTRTVVVRPGETLWVIAARTGVTVAALVVANGLRDPNVILAGTVLRIPAAAVAPASTSGATAGLPLLLLDHPDRLALRPLFARWASTFSVSAPLLEATCWWESGWQPGVVSSTGAVGIGQLEPDTVAFVSAVLLGRAPLNPADASQNIEMTAAYLHHLLVLTGGNSATALAAYYQGWASVQAHGWLASTHTYVHGILETVPSFAG